MQLDRPLGNATVELFDAQSQPLERTVTDASGRFGFSAVPRNFRVVATSPGGEESYAADYRDFDGRRQIVISPLTNILVVYHDLHPEVPDDEARSRIKSYFSMAPEHGLETHMVKGGRRAGFSVSRYLAHARAGGGRARSDSGRTAFVAGLVEEIHSGQTTRARGFSESAADWLQGASDLGSAVAAISVAKIFGNTYLSSTQLLTGWILNSVLDGFFSSSSSVATQLQQILNQLSSLANEVREADQQLLQQIATDLTLTDLATINTTAVNYLSSVNSTGSAASVVTNQAALQTSLTDLASRVGGTTVTTGLLSQILVNATQAQGNANWLPLLGNTNGIGNVTFFAYNYYANMQTQGIQMLVDILHSGTVPSVATALEVYDNYCQSLTAQQNQIPRPLDSDNVLYHQKTGLLFYSHIFAPDTPQNAVAFAATFQEGGYQNWRVMNMRDMSMWLEGSGGGYNDAQGNTGIQASDLQNWGFDITNLGSTADFNYDPDDQTPKAYWAVNDCDLNYSDCPSGGPQSYFFGSGGVSGGGGVPWGHGQSSVLPLQPYVLVCDASSQDPSLLRDLGTPVALNLDSGPLPSGLEAYAQYSVNQVTNEYVVTSGNFSVNVNDRVAWSATPPNAVRIQTWPAGAASPPALTNGTTPPGFVGPYGAGFTTFYSTANNVTANLTASLGALNQSLSVVVNPTNSSSGLTVQVPPPALTGIRITPRSQFYGVGNQSATGSYPYTCNTYFSDGTSGNLTANVTWTITPATSGAAMTAAGPTGYALQLATPAQASPVAFNLTLTATSQGFTDSTVIQITPPLAGSRSQ